MEGATDRSVPRAALGEKRGDTRAARGGVWGECFVVVGEDMETVRVFRLAAGMAMDACGELCPGGVAYFGWW